MCEYSEILGCIEFGTLVRNKCFTIFGIGKGSCLKETCGLNIFYTYVISQPKYIKLNSGCMHYALQKIRS